MRVKELPLQVSRRAHLLGLIKYRLLSWLFHQPSKLAFCAPGDIVGRAIMAFGTFEPEVIELIGVTARQFLRDPSETVFIDVGANVGTHAVGLASAFRRVLAFEANPATALVAKANALAAGAHNVEVHPIGLSDETRDAVLSMPNPHAFSWASVNPVGSIGIGITLQPGDQYLARVLGHDERVGVIKIDVEGYEPEVLSGLRSTLITQKPIVAFEALDETATKRSIELLQSLGYCSFVGVSTRTRPLLQRIWGLLKVRKVYLEEISVGTGYSCVIALPHQAGVTDPQSGGLLHDGPH